MARFRLLLVSSGLLIALAGLSVFALSDVALADPSDSATVLFGDPTGSGSPFPPQDDHDSSPHAADKLVPRTSVISAGGTVTFKTFGVHQVGIYEAGTKPGDIDISIQTPGNCVPVPLIDDPDNRLAILGDQPCAGGPIAPSYTFNAPGRYLVICNFLPHFAEADMYGWVIVK